MDIIISGVLALLIIVPMFTIGAIGLYLWYAQQVRKKRALEAKRARDREEARQHFLSFLKIEWERVQAAVDEFSQRLDDRAGYFSNYEFISWKTACESTFNQIIKYQLRELELESPILNMLQRFLDCFRNGETIRADFNRNFVDRELRGRTKFFDECVEGKSLDLQQRTAIVTDEDNNLVIAGAGTGKTTTILGKVNYVLDRYSVDPGEILLISFTRKSAEELKRRMKAEAIEVKTFHKFGKDVIQAVEGRPPSIFDEEQFQPLITRLFREFLRDSEYLARVTEYFTEFLKRPRSPFEFQNQGDYIQYLKDQNFRTYKQKLVEVRGRTTYRMEVVKSIEECKIANFLFFNNIDYEYEFPYEYDTSPSAYRAYKPDFTIRQKGRKVYLEHLALDRQGKVPTFFAKEGETYRQAKTRYTEKIQWARAEHGKHGTCLIETYSYEMSEGSLFENLAERLSEAGIVLHPKSPEEIWRIITEAAKEEVDSLLALLQTFITLMKSNNYSVADVVQRNTHTQDGFERQRNALFVQIVAPLFEEYESYLQERKEIDFSDMINRAAQYIREGRFTQRYRYVIIDEFQDISIGRYQLVKAIKERNPACKLFCVGDDWQSIYRFTGSDIALFREFDRFFGFTVRSKIETTYRFHEPLIQLSSDFILKNPNQERKALKGTPTPAWTEYKIIYSEDQDDTRAVKQVFDEILATMPDAERKTVLVLGRYTFDIDRIKNQAGVFEINRRSETICYWGRTESGTRKTLEAQYLTVHKAKGLEGDVVIVLNCNAGKHGFPSQLSDDPVLNLLLSKADQFENGEERRLFYVAMTRAKERLYLIADRTYKSKFITELETGEGSLPIRKCPRCRTADLVRKSGTKNGRPWAFWGCSNYLFGCDYIEWIN